jgi:hypothetical protein
MSQSHLLRLKSCFTKLDHEVHLTSLQFNNSPDWAQMSVSTASVNVITQLVEDEKDFMYTHFFAPMATMMKNHLINKMNRRKYDNSDMIVDTATPPTQVCHSIAGINPFYHLSPTALKFYQHCMQGRNLNTCSSSWLEILNCKARIQVGKLPLTHLLKKALQEPDFLGEYERALLNTEVEPFFISDDDIRVQLRGQKGLRALRSLNVGELLIPIRMWLGTEAEYYQTIASHETTDAAMYDSDIMTPTHEDEVLVGTMFGHFGNFSACINDFRHLENNPHCGKTLAFFQSSQKQFKQNINVQMIEVTFCGFPYLFFSNTKPIQQGSELLADYGDLYWTSLQSLKLQRQQARDT